MSDVEDEQPVVRAGVPEPVIPPEQDPAPSEHEPEGDARPSRPSRWPMALAAALLVVATFLGVLAAQFKAQLDEERGRRQDVEEVAARFATSFFSYDYRTLEANLDSIRDDATAKFGNDYERFFRSNVVTLVTELKAQSRGAVTDVYLGEIDTDEADALVVLNVERQGAGGRIPVAGTYLALDLVRVGGHWKVDNATSINLTAPGTSTATPRAPAAPGATTTTSVPG
jgi:Mce-associated membrane protein